MLADDRTFSELVWEEAYQMLTVDEGMLHSCCFVYVGKLFKCEVKMPILISLCVILSLTSSSLKSNLEPGAAAGQI